MIKPIFIFFLLISTIAPGLAWSQSAREFKAQESEIRQQMEEISRQLGVTCTACHNSGNFKSDELKAFKVSQEHMRITQMLIDKGMDGKNGPKANCFMCHRGQLQPEFRQQLNKLLTE